MAIGGLAATTHAIQVLRTFSDVRDHNKVLALRGELLALLVDAKEEQLQMLEERQGLNARIQALEAWDAERARYALTNASKYEGGTPILVYALKDGVEPTEADHYLCPTCFQRGRKSILHNETRTPGMDEFLVCFECDTDIVVNGQRRADHGKTRGRR